MKRNFEFSFSKALNFMKRGIRVSRTNMEGFVGLKWGIGDTETSPYFYHITNIASEPKHGIVWKPSTADLLAEDWITAEDKLDLI